MAYRICTSFEIENGHLLSKHPGLCNFPRGHSRNVDSALGADDLDAHEIMDNYLVRHWGGQ